VAAAIDPETIAYLDTVRGRLVPLLPTIGAELSNKLGASGHPGLREAVEAWLAAMLYGPWDATLDDRVAGIGRRCVELGVTRSRIVSALGVVRGAHIQQITAETPSACLAIAALIDRLFEATLAVWLDAYSFESDLRITRDARALQTLSSGLAHGLRNPLNSARLQLDVLERRLRRHTADSALIEPVGRVQTELARAAALIRDLVSYAQPSTLVLQHTEIDELIARVVADERPLADERGVRIEVTGAPVAARVDKHKLGEVLRHLMRNAIEASSRDGVVEVTLTVEDDQVWIGIADHGAGIREDILAQIYDPFFSTKPAGTGLGLSIARSLLDVHGGSIRVTTGSAGTRFAISLPQREDDVARGTLHDPA
jgi:signal transduction histidine kinase